MTADVVTQIAFARGRVLHGTTGRPLRGEVEIFAQEGPIVATVHEDGRFMLSGDLRILFPQLATMNYQLNLIVRGRSAEFKAGTAELSTVVNVLAGTQFDPPAPTPPHPLIDLHELRLAGDPMFIRGRVTDARNPGTAIPGATVTLSESFPAVTSVAVAMADAAGDYQFNGINFGGPVRLKCDAAGFRPVERELFVNLEAPMHTENFQLPPP